MPRTPAILLLILAIAGCTNYPQNNAGPASIARCGPVVAAEMGEQDSEVISKQERDNRAKRLILLCGFLPILLLALTHVHPLFSVPTILYFLIAILINPFLFFSILIFFSVASSLFLLFACVFFGDVGGYVVYLIFVLMLVS